VVLEDAFVFVAWCDYRRQPDAFDRLSQDRSLLMWQLGLSCPLPSPSYVPLAHSCLVLDCCFTHSFISISRYSTASIFFQYVDPNCFPHFLSFQQLILGAFGCFSWKHHELKYSGCPTSHCLF
jgi:hypothetical protein